MGLELVTTQTYNGLDCNFYRNDEGEMFLSRNQLGKALGYSDPPRALSKLHNRYFEKLIGHYIVDKIESTDGSMRDTILYDFRGVAEICMRSRIPGNAVADNFMDWIGEIYEKCRKLEKETKRKEEEKIMEMNLVTTEKFGNVDCGFYRDSNNEMLLTRNQIGTALGYSNPDTAVSKIHMRHKDRLDKFSVSTKLVATDGKAYDTTLYNEIGVMEICRLSRQPNADQFMDWTWDIVKKYRNGTLQVPGNQQYVTVEQLNQIITPLVQATTSCVQNVERLIAVVEKLAASSAVTSSYKSPVGIPEVVKTDTEWKRAVSSLVRKHCSQNNISNSGEFLSSIYKQIQSQKGYDLYELKKQIGLPTWSTLTVIASVPDCKTDFEQAFERMTGIKFPSSASSSIQITPTPLPEKKIEIDWNTPEEGIQKLASLINDKSVGHGAIYRKLYKELDKDTNWNYYKTRYRKTSGRSTMYPSRMAMIKCSTKLTNKCNQIIASYIEAIQ